jgi:hypothetical protein
VENVDDNESVKCKITDIDADTRKDSIKLKWVWPHECQKILVLFLWKMDNSNIENYSDDELLVHGKTVYRDEYIISGNCFEYRPAPDDYGYLEFRVLPVIMDDVSNNQGRIIRQDDEGNNIRISGKPKVIKYKIIEKKKLFAKYKMVYIKIHSDISMKKETLVYKKSGCNFVYSFPSNITSDNTWGPIIVMRSENIHLMVSDKYRQIIRLTEG